MAHGSYPDPILADVKNEGKENYQLARSLATTPKQ
jgi:hypothetical protein